MVKVYCLEQWLRRLQQHSVAVTMPHALPLCCSLSADGLLFVGTSLRTLQVIDPGGLRAATIVPTVGIPSAVHYSLLGGYVTTLEGVDASAAPSANVYAYTNWSAPSSPRSPRLARVCLVGDESYKLPATSSPTTQKPSIFAVHHFPTSGSAPVLAVCPLSSRLAVADAGVTTIYSFNAATCRFTASQRVTLSFLAHEVALAGDACTASGDSRFAVVWATASCGTVDGRSVASVNAGKDSTAAVRSLSPPTLLLPSMLKSLHARTPLTFELSGADAKAVPLADDGDGFELILFRKFHDGEQLHSLSIVPLTARTDFTEVAVFVSTNCEGFLYTACSAGAVLTCVFHYMSPVFKALPSLPVLTACGSSGIEVYTSKVCSSAVLAECSQVCSDLREPILLATEEVKGLIHFLGNANATYFFTDRWYTYESFGVLQLSADMLGLAQDLSDTSADAKLQVLAEGLRLSLVGSCGGSSVLNADLVVYQKLCLAAADLLSRYDLSEDKEVAVQEKVLALYFRAGLTTFAAVVEHFANPLASPAHPDVVPTDPAKALGTSLALTSSLNEIGLGATRTALLALTRECAQLHHDVCSKKTAMAFLSSVVTHCQPSLYHALLHLVHGHPSLLDEFGPPHEGSTDDDDGCSAIWSAMHSFHAGQVEETGLFGTNSRVLPRKVAEAIAHHPCIIINSETEQLTDFAKYVRSQHVDLFVAILTGIIAKHIVNTEDMLRILDKSSGGSSRGQKLYLEALLVYCLDKGEAIDNKFAEYLCQLLLDNLANMAEKELFGTATGASHQSRHSSYFVPQLTNGLAKFRPSWLNEPSMYSAAVRQMCTHKAARKVPVKAVATNRQGSVAAAATVVSSAVEPSLANSWRWLCACCHDELLKLQGLLSCGLLDRSYIEAVVGSTLKSMKASGREVLGSTSIRLLCLAPVPASGPDCTGPSVAFVSALADCCPAALPLLLHSTPLPPSIADDLFAIMLRVLGRRIHNIAELADEERGIMLSVYEDVVKYASRTLTFDQLLAVVPANGSVDYFLPYLEHAAKHIDTNFSTTAAVTPQVY